MIEIMIDLQGGAKAPLYEKIYEYIKRDVIAGKIPVGEKLPSTRLLSKHLSVSRSTVEMAYEQLLAEGYIKAEPCRGFFVCDITELYEFGHAENGSKDIAPFGKKGQKEKMGEDSIDFSPYAIDTEHFPYNVWRKLNKNVLLDDREELLLSGDGQGDYGLRKAIAAYLHQARGVNCEPDQLIIGAGNEYLEILLTQILGRNKRVLMENPTYLQAYHTFLNMGYQMSPVTVEEDGIDPWKVRKYDPDIVYIMPSHQFPLGTVMPLKQRLELLKWASEKENRYLIEDDHDSEYRYRGKPIPSLQSVDHFDKVIYIGTFSKSIAPSLRISYMVLPPELLNRYHEKCGFYSATVPKIQQEVLRAFIEEGHFERHLNKMRGIYRAKHDFLLAELKKRNWVEKVYGDHAGLHVLVQIRTEKKEAEICDLAGKQGIRIYGISEYVVPEMASNGYENTKYSKYSIESEKIGSAGTAPDKPILLLGYGRLCEDEIRKGLLILDTII
jgi:GntR family transcriptional regulator/MocR family aminotransferase